LTTGIEDAQPLALDQITNEGRLAAEGMMAEIHQAGMRFRIRAEVNLEG